MGVLSIIFLILGIYVLIKVLVVISFQKPILKWVKTVIKDNKKVRNLIIIEFIFALALILIGIILRNL